MNESIQGTFLSEGTLRNVNHPLTSLKSGRNDNRSRSNAGCFHRLYGLYRIRIFQWDSVGTVHPVSTLYKRVYQPILAAVQETISIIIYLWK